MKIANIDREILHIFLTTWGISMKFSGKMGIIMINLKVTKNQCFTLSLQDTLFEKPQEDGGGVGGQIDPPATLGLIENQQEEG